jgi:hypothetical protein
VTTGAALALRHAVIRRALAGVAVAPLMPTITQAGKVSVTEPQPATLGAELFTPRGDGPHPLVILLHGCAGGEAPLRASERVLMRALRSLAAVMLLVGLGGPAVAGERWDALRSLPRVDLEITFSPNHPELTAEEVRRRLEDALRRMHPAPTVDSTSADRLRLTIAVRSYSSADLRGFYLPLSQAYGIGPVRLSLERPAAVSGLSSPVWAIVWQSERQAKGPWRSSATEILELADEVLASFLADYRRALGQ